MSCKGAWTNFSNKRFSFTCNIYVKDTWYSPFTPNSSSVFDSSHTTWERPLQEKGGRRWEYHSVKKLFHFSIAEFPFPRILLCCRILPNGSIKRKFNWLVYVVKSTWFTINNTNQKPSVHLSIYHACKLCSVLLEIIFNY